VRRPGRRRGGAGWRSRRRRRRRCDPSLHRDARRAPRAGGCNRAC
jgi:hypothetical protein